ncbi:MAG: hypothetical protein N3C12_01345 [Candidatus Binatia bacterium]|nr:hypothetical protein [Candidatus Binatia bacterium]
MPAVIQRVERRADGVRVIRKDATRSRWILALVVLALGSAAVLLWWNARVGAPAFDGSVSGSSERAAPVEGFRQEGGTKLDRVAIRDSRREIGGALKPTDVQERHAPGRAPAPSQTSASAEKGTTEAEPAGASGGDEPSGIALFPPPGTNPPKSGLIVPDDFELPPGYMRHYQVTDDGKPLPPILMFHPDAELYDTAGNRIPLPEDLVVPAGLAPPGLPQKMLEVPESGVPLFEPPPREEVAPSLSNE